MSARSGQLGSPRPPASVVRRTWQVTLVIALLLSFVAVSASRATGQADPSADPGAADAGASGRVHQHESAPPKEDTTSTDVIVSASEDGNGYHLYRATGVDGWVWHPLATIQPGGDGEDAWIGYHCVTGTGRYVVVVVAPRHAINRPAVRDRGGLAYVVDATDGKVRALASGVAFKYHSPGCGVDDSAVLTRYLGEDQHDTEILRVDATSAAVTDQTTLPGQLTSAVPVGDRIVAASGAGIVDIADPKTPIATFDGQPFALHPSADGVDLLVAAKDQSATTVVAVRDGAAETVGAGPLTAVQLFGGRDGVNTVVGASELAPDSGLRSVAVPQGLAPEHVEGTSLDGSTVEASPANGKEFGGPSATTPSADDLDTSDGLNAEAHQLTNPGLYSSADGSDLGQTIPSDVAKASTLLPDGVTRVRPDPASGKGAGLTRSASVPQRVRAAVPATNTTTPVCAVPRNDPRRQVPQPNAARVNWAIQQADRNQLTGANARPANFLNLGLNAYSPSSDFHRNALHGYASADIPPSVIQAVFAQESNWWQASWHALPGLSGNPLIADYYGAGGTLSQFDYDHADCGYGISQLTDGMRTTDTQLSANGKTKVAVDYAENIAAGIQKLVDKWNQVYDLGFTVNGGDPQYLENWYFAIWAYNTGINANDGAGNSGLGWTNNPMNADYPPNRPHFLRLTYADAAHPGDWPYQERVIGWMEQPLVVNGGASYAGANSSNNGLLTIPAISTFCTTANSCSPTYIDPNDASKSYCTLASRHCWWHWPATFASCPSQCATSSFTYATNATEPAITNPHPPACNSTLAAPTRGSLVIVEDDPNGYNVVGCGAGNFTRGGTFATTMGALGVLDWHQLGAGLSGRTYFTHNVAAGDTDHQITGTWTPPASISGAVDVLVHVPDTGATTSSAHYVVYPGDGSSTTVVVNQHYHINRWESLGTFNLQAGAKVTLTNVTDDATTGSLDVAYDGVAFSPTTGTLTTKTFDAVGLIDENQDLNTDVPGGLVDSVALTMNGLYSWADGATGPVVALPACSGALSSSCVGTQTRAAIAAWRARVVDAGTNPNHVGDTMAKWLNLSNPDPPGTINQAWLDDPEHFKIRSQAKVTFISTNGHIDANSVRVGTQFNSGVTDFPAFVKDFMNGLSSDYGVAVPDLTYQALDLGHYSHETTTVNPLSGAMPARAYKPWMSQALTDGGACVGVRTVSGGSTALKQMVLDDGVRTAASLWANAVHAKVTAGQAPAALGTTADAIIQMYFDAGNAATLPVDGNSPWWVAGPIWIEQNFRVCTDGSIQPGPGQTVIANNSFMPDLYLFVDGTQVDWQGTPRAAAPRGVASGDVVNFAHTYLGPPNDLFNDNPWTSCDWNGASTLSDFRNGQPWDLWFFAAEDEVTDAVRFCDDAVGVYH